MQRRSHKSCLPCQKRQKIYSKTSMAGTASIADSNSFLIESTGILIAQGDKYLGIFLDIFSSFIMKLYVV